MLITLIVLLTIMSISLRIAMAGLELSYQVGKRVKGMGELAGKAATKNKSKGISSVVKGGLKSGAKIAIRGSVSVAKAGLKSTIAIIRIVISLLRNLLTIVAVWVLVVDILVFFIIVAVVGIYTTQFM